MSIYGISEELISLTNAVYNNFECAVVEEGETTEWSQVKSGVVSSPVWSKTRVHHVRFSFLTIN